MTSRQLLYIENRSKGMQQERAAIQAGYAKSSAGVTASRMERLPAIQSAIAAAQKLASVSVSDAPEFESAEDYLQAVVEGRAIPDPLRISAARTLIAYQKGKQRAPVKSATPTQLHRSQVLNEEQSLLDAWAEKARIVRARLAKG